MPKALLACNSGKIYVNAMGWTSNPQDSIPMYDQPEHFLRFLDKYDSHAIGSHYFLQWSKSNRSKTFLDKVIASDIGSVGGRLADQGKVQV